MPLSSLVILISRAPSQLPLRVTSVALGADRRNVTVWSGWISGETGRGVVMPRPAAACWACAAGKHKSAANTKLHLPNCFMVVPSYVAGKRARAACDGSPALRLAFDSIALFQIPVF